MALDSPTQWNWREEKQETALIVSEVFFFGRTERSIECVGCMVHSCNCLDGICFDFGVDWSERVT